METLSFLFEKVIHSFFQYLIDIDLSPFIWSSVTFIYSSIYCIINILRRRTEGYLERIILRFDICSFYSGCRYDNINYNIDIFRCWWCYYFMDYFVFGWNRASSPRPSLRQLSGRVCVDFLCNMGYLERYYYLHQQVPRLWFNPQVIYLHPNGMLLLLESPLLLDNHSLIDSSSGYISYW